MTIIITGSEGFIGKHMMKAIPDAVGIDIEGDPSRDICKRYDIINLIHQGDKILHLAAFASIDLCEKFPKEAAHTNIKGTINLIKHAIEAGAERIVYASTGSIYSPYTQCPIRENSGKGPTTIYGLTKLHAEQYIRHYQNLLPHIILRYGYIYGNGKQGGAINNWLNGGNTIYGDPMRLQDFTYIKDIVQANLLALNENQYTNWTYNIGSDQPLVLSAAYYLCQKQRAIYKPARLYDYPEFYYDIYKAREFLGYNPKYTLEKGLEDMKNETDISVHPNKPVEATR